MQQSRASEELDRRLAEFQFQIESPRNQLRRKLYRLILEINHGKRSVSRYGVHVDVINEFERILADTSDGDIAKALRILRE